jgi:sialate O-acetylesterase
MEASAIRLSFDHTTGGLKTSDGKRVRGFAVAGPDHKFYWADARIEGNEIVVSSSNVNLPVAVRYAWADNPDCNVVNGEGLPMFPFRTDDWQGITYGKK